MTPTGLGIRSDRGGLGHYGAPRTKTVAGKNYSYAHEGVDYKCEPGQKVWMPVTGRIVDKAFPYADMSYSGVLIVAKRMTFKIFYIEPYPGVIGKTLKIGEPFGTAQDISLRYKEHGVTPHVHVQIEQADPEIFFSCTELPAWATAQP